MSSDSITVAQNPETARLQGTQKLAGAVRASQVRHGHSDPAQRQASTAGGQGLPAAASSHVSQPPPVGQVESAVSKISDFVQNFQRDLVFTIDQDSERLVVKIVDSKTKEVIRQIPSEESLRIAKALDSASSVIFRERA
jgi:flagellar protein FlaG